jgi:hypothetical protein
MKWFTEKSLLWLIVIMLAYYVGHDAKIAWFLVVLSTIDHILIGLKAVRQS